MSAASDVATACEGCGIMFALRQSEGDCPKCVKLSDYTVGSENYLDVQRWPQCAMCGITRRNMRGPSLSTMDGHQSITCGSTKCTGSDESHESPTPAAQAMQPRAHIRNVLTEATQNRITAVRERFGQTAAWGGSTTPNTTASLLHHEHGGGVAGEAKIWVGWQVRSNQYPKVIDADLGGGIKRLAMSRFMQDIKAEILEGINIEWVRSRFHPILPEETSIRWSGNRTLDPNTSSLSAQDFYNFYNIPSDSNAATRSTVTIPTFFKGSVKSSQKGPMIFIEIYIDWKTWSARINELELETEMDGVNSQTERRKRPRNESTASLTSDRMKQLKQVSQRPVFQSSFNTSGNRNHRTIGSINEATCHEVTLEKHMCTADVIDGNASVMTTRTTIAGTLSDKPFSSGTMKLAFDLHLKDGTHLVAKRFFRLSEDIPLDEKDHILNDVEHQHAIDNEGIRLAECTWFLKHFYKHCSEDYPDVVVDTNIQFSTTFIGKETSHPASVASGMADELFQPNAWWLIEPKRASLVTKFSGTLNHSSNRKDLQSLTIYALSHFVYLYSKGTRVLADIQGTTSNIKGKDILVLFDVMTHSLTGETGIGDCGPEGIESFLNDHTCGTICLALRLNKHKVENDSTGGKEDEANSSTSSNHNNDVD